MEELSRVKVLVLCGQNKKRSKTAEWIYRNSNSMSVRSTGVSESSVRKVSTSDMEWADIVLVMEDKHKERLANRFGNLRNKVEILDIPDIYEYRDPELVDILTEKIEWAVGNYLNLHG